MQRPQIAAFDLRIPFVLRLEVPFCREIVEEAGEPADHGLRDVTGGRHDVPQDLLHERQERLVVCRGRRQGWLLTLNFSDDLVGQCVEGAGRHRHPAPRLDPLRHLGRCVFRKGQQQELARLPYSGFHEVSGLGCNNARLARPRAGQNQRGVFVDDN